MRTDSPLRHDLILETYRQPSNIAALVDTQALDPSLPHFEQNILEWLTYLPMACVKRMVQMGWDITT